MPAELSPAHVGLVQSRNAAAQAMVYAVANTGSGQFLPAVERFQQVWNMALAATTEQARIAGVREALISTVLLPLVEDGRYGPQTATRLSIILGVPAPTRASAMPTWFAQSQNRALVEQLVPLNVQPVEAIIDPIVPAPPNAMSPQVIDAASASGSLAREIIGPTESPAPVPSSEVVFADDEPPGDLLPDLVEGPPGVPEVTTTRIVEDVQYSYEDAPVLGTRRKGLYPFVAVGVGAAALGSVLWYFTRRGRRRRYA